MSSSTGWVSLVERGYDLHADEKAWLTGIFEHAAPLIGGREKAAWEFTCTPNVVTVGQLAEGSAALMSWAVRAFHRLASDDCADLVYRSGHIVGTASQVCFPVQPPMRLLFERLFGAFARDILMVGVHSGIGGGVVLATSLNEISAPTRAQRKRWSQVAAHLGAAHRLRKICCHLPLDASSIEAILDPAGVVQHACGPAKAPSARVRLREALLRIDRARTQRERSEPDGALDVWEGLVDGRWSLVDRFDTDGRRFVLAIKNDPAHPDPRGLSPRERQVGELVGLGQSSKEIAYALGVSLSAVTNAATAAMAKLGVSSRSGLTEFFSPAFPRAKLADLLIGHDALALVACCHVDQRAIASLAPAERAIVLDLLRGSTNADIAARRGSSVNTVNFQIQGLYRKLDVHSRTELASRLRSADRASLPEGCHAALASEM